MRRAVWAGALILPSVFAVMGSLPRDALFAAEQTGVIAPADTVQALRTTLRNAVQRFEAQDVPGVLAYVSEQYRTGPLTKPGIREQLIAVYSLYDAVKVRVHIDEVRMVGEHAWIYSTGEVSGRLRLVGTWIMFLSWQRELEVARREAGGWRLFGDQR